MTEVCSLRMWQSSPEALKIEPTRLRAACMSDYMSLVGGSMADFWWSAHAQNHHWPFILARPLLEEYSLFILHRINSVYSQILGSLCQRPQSRFWYIPITFFLVDTEKNIRKQVQTYLSAIAMHAFYAKPLARSPRGGAKSLQLANAVILPRAPENSANTLAHYLIEWVEVTPRGSMVDFGWSTHAENRHWPFIICTASLGGI